MPDLSARQGDPRGDRLSISSPSGGGRARSNTGLGLLRRYLIALLFLLIAALWQFELRAESESQAKCDFPKNDNSFDIGIIIDNRPNWKDDASKADIDALLKMFDQQMHIEHIMLFERPPIEVVCDIFGCPGSVEPRNPFPPLLWQITSEEQSRLVVYYVGDGRVEGLERQLLFLRTDEERDGDVVAFPVEYLHDSLEGTRSDSVVVLLDTSFAQRPLPCAGEDPLLINDALLRVRRNYQRIARDHWNRNENLELSATTPVQPAHCDRFDEVLLKIEEPLFTKFLLRGVVKAEADQGNFGNGDGLIDLGELSDYLDDRIRRAARFQWGRLQNVRRIGPRSRDLASVDPRQLNQCNADVIARRNRPSDPDDDDDGEAAPDGGGERQNTEMEPKDPVARCREDPSAEDCHPCVVDLDGKACAERCQEEGNGSDFCDRHLIASTETAPS